MSRLSRIRSEAINETNKKKKGRSMDAHLEGATNTTFAPGRHKPSRRHCF
jgi:hypothetical protein